MRSSTRRATSFRGLANKCLGLGVDRDDLYQEGYVGLMIAVDRYDPDLGNRFATYATYWIRNRLAGLLDNRHTIKIPAHSKLPPIAVDGYLDDVPSMTPAVEEAFERLEMSVELRQAILLLPRREMAIIVWHYGLDGASPRTLAAIGDELGVSITMVSRVLRRARRQLAEYLTTRYLRGTEYPERCNPNRPPRKPQPGDKSAGINRASRPA